MFSIEMLPAGNGDCLWIEYGDTPHRVLIDGGTQGTSEALKRRLEQLPEAERAFELLVVTHIDGDHIDGIVDLFVDGKATARFGDIWFNGYRHLPAGQLEPMGPIAGERLTTWLAQQHAWNEAFHGGAVVVPSEGPLRTIELPSGMRLTVLSPGQTQLARLKPVWETVVRAAGLEPGVAATPDTTPPGLQPLGGPTTPDVATLAATPFDRDTAEANGSSIALLAEFEGKAVVLGADAHADVLLTGLKRLAEDRGEAPAYSAVKVAHHGSRRNVSCDLAAQMKAPLQLISTNGVGHQHPNPESIARLLVSAATDGLTTLTFNYRSAANGIWDDPSLKQAHRYVTDYPDDGTAGKVVQIA